MKLVADTSVYIDFFNLGKHEDILLYSGYFTHLAPIVIIELLAGSRTPQDRRAVEGLVSVSERAGRVVRYGTEDYALAGRTLAALRYKRGYDIRKTTGMTNDVFIAIAARKIGALLVTKDGRDFEAIREVMDFKLRIVE